MVRVHCGGFLNYHPKWMQATHRSICMLINNKRVHIFPLCSKRGFSLIPTWIFRAIVTNTLGISSFNKLPLSGQ